VQFALVYQARHALEHALAQAARQGAVEHASAEAILRGLAAGLVPYLYGAEDWAGLLAAEARAREHVALGMSGGWILLRQRSPTRESFDDWAEPALGPMGGPIPGLVEIPNDNLDNRRLRTRPVSGIAGTSMMGEPVGRRSGQSLADANLLRLELAYGVRLAVPVVGPLVLRTLSLWHGCAPGSGEATAGPRQTGSGTDRLGLLDLGMPARGTSPAHWTCAFHAARDGEERPRGRIPVRLSATVRMMSTARSSAFTGSRVDVASDAGMAPGPRAEPDPRDEPASREETAPERLPGRQATGGAVGVSPPLANGFLRIGSDRAYPVPSGHPALCAS
jgi:hypothetical protein